MQNGVNKQTLNNLSYTNIINVNNNTPSEDSDDKVSLMGASDSYIYVSSYLAATRNGYNHFMFTWNRALFSSFKLYNVWRIFTTTNPKNISFNSNWLSSDTPNNILSNVANIKYKQIDVSNGDLYEEWVDSDTYNGYYVICLVIYALDDADMVYGTYSINTTSVTNYCISDAPSLSYDKTSNNFTIGTSMSGRRIIEFHRTDVAYGYPSSIKNENTLNEMLIASIIGEEYGGDEIYCGYYYANDNKLNRWAKGRYTVGVNFRDTQNKSRISNAINSALSEINSVLNSYGIYFTRSSSATSGDITITVDTEYNLYGIDLYNDDYVYGGQWNVSTDSSGYINSADITLACDVFEIVPYSTYESTALEEIAQSMGAGYDQSEVIKDTIHIEFNYLNKPDYLTTNDQNILRLLYSDYVNAGDNCTTVSKALNIPKGIYQPSTSTTNSVRTVSGKFLEANANYAVRAFIVNSSGKVSYTSDWINITTPDVIRPDNWNWITPVSANTYIPFSNNAFYPVTAAEWNNFLDRIDKFREYLGLSSHGISHVSSGDDFTMVKYNQAVQAIAECNVNLSTISSSQAYLSFDLFNRLSVALNNIN